MSSCYPWHQPLWQQLSTMREQGRVPHAVLLTGGEGLAKSAFATQLAATQLCLAPDNGNACGQCHSCQLFAAGGHPDHYLLQPEDNGKTIKIDQIRALKQKQALTPNIGRWKTVIISPADAMTVSASNSLLKLLEEPSANTLMIVVTAKAHQLPITIRSRCQRLVVSSADIDQCRQWLTQQNLSVSAAVLQQLFDITGGAPLLIQQLLEQQLLAALQTVDADFLQLLQGEANIVQLAQQWQDYDLLLILNHCRQRLVQQVQALLQGDSVLPLPTLDLSACWRLLDCILQTIKLISSQNNFNKTLLIEDFMVTVSRQQSLSQLG